MVFVDKIKKFIEKINIKKLPSINIIQTEVIPIIYKTKSEEKIAEIIRQTINQDSDIYKIFLNKYEAICIGETESSFNNILRCNNLENNLIHEKKKFREQIIKNKAKYWLDDTIDEIYKDRFPVSIQTIKSDYKNKENSIIYYGMTQSDDFYYTIVQKKENSKLFFRFLCDKKDKKGIELLVNSKNDNEFIEKYTEENLYSILNWAVGFHTIRRDNNFFNKNINLIDAAVKYTMFDGINLANQYISAESKEARNEIDKKIDAQYDNTNNIEIDKNSTIELVKEILESLDTSKKMSQYFTEKMELGKIMLYNINEKSSAIEKLTKLYGTQDQAEFAINNKKSFYNAEYDMCINQIVGNITDIPTIIHEFIHQYYENNGRADEFSREIPSVFFEKVSINYLINNGYKQSADALTESFESRKRNDSVNNVFVLKDFVEMTKIKNVYGAITPNNILNDAIVLQMSRNLKRDVNSIKNQYAKEEIRRFAMTGLEEKDTMVKLCSYALGTLFAGIYGDNNIMKEKMFDLIDNKAYLLQDLINDVVVNKNKEIEDKCENEKS